MKNKIEKAACKVAYTTAQIILAPFVLILSIIGIEIVFEDSIR